MSLGWFQALLAQGVSVDTEAVYLNGYNIDPLNRYVILYFNKPIYSGSGGALVASDLSLSFSGGTASNITIASVKTVANTALSGGEDTIRVNITVTGTASGAESILLKPSSDSSIKDIDGGLAPIINNTVNDLISKTYDTDYQNVLSYAITQGYVVPIKEYRNVENALMIEAKSIGLFALTDVMMPLLPWGDVNYALTDWKRLVTTTVGGTLAYTRGTGFNPTAAGYIDTLWTPSTQGVNYTLNAASAIHNSLTNSVSNTMQAYGCRHSDANASKRIGMIALDTGDHCSGTLNSGALSSVVGVTSSAKLYHQTRDGSGATNHDIYLEGVLFDGSNAGSVGVPDQSLVLFAERLANGSISVQTSRNANLFFFGGSTGSIAAAIKTMRDNYNTAVAAVSAGKDITTYGGTIISTDTPTDIRTDN